MDIRFTFNGRNWLFFVGTKSYSLEELSYFLPHEQELLKAFARHLTKQIQLATTAQGVQP